ncbi:hypothetical protein ACJX0J_024271, partial [Zea mays]
DTAYKVYMFIRFEMELEREYMGTATQFEQATVETTGDNGTEGQGDANFALLCTQDWLRREYRGIDYYRKKVYSINLQGHIIGSGDEETSLLATGKNRKYSS